MQPTKVQEILCSSKVCFMFSSPSRKYRFLCSRIRWLIRRRPKAKFAIRRFRKLNLKGWLKEAGCKRSASHLHGQMGASVLQRPVRIATFNAAMFSLAPAVPEDPKPVVFCPEVKDYMKVMNTTEIDIWAKFVNGISLTHDSLLGSVEVEREGLSSMITSCRDNRTDRSRVPARSPLCFPSNFESLRSSGSILEVLREVNAGILALQDVKAVEEDGMKPLSDLAGALGMNYVFAESWAPEYGNAVLSKWPIKRWKVHKIVDDEDFRNVLKVTIDVPRMGEINFHCTQLDHLDENWRMKQVNAIIKSNDFPHIMAGGLNSLDGSDYSSERWTKIAKFYEEIGKPAPKVQVMKLLKDKGYADAKDSAGEFDLGLVIAEGQNVQGTCKYGTRVDYILASSGSPYKFVPGSYSVISSRGTSDHHIVKAEVVRVKQGPPEKAYRRVENSNKRYKTPIVFQEGFGRWTTRNKTSMN
ncbi:uncharacterized protein LOC131150451 [Malania oleifera]|uniref:uncharacterized protein LOC131150451 n=1 Tax=Malania oleifera TaxID=397392 RepID=UPI0025ADC0D7|nr:uncharacterized protein LOC131150451 [Malania oleifera]